jgi:hypothetical protein
MSDQVVHHTNLESMNPNWVPDDVDAADSDQELRRLLTWGELDEIEDSLSSQQPILSRRRFRQISRWT